MAAQYPVRAIRTTFDIIDYLAGSEPVGISELADDLNLAKSTAHDHLRTLEQLGYVINDDGVYTISTKFLEIGSRHRNSDNLFKAARQEVDDLAFDTETHTNLMVDDNGLGVVLYASAGTTRINLDYAYEGMRSKLHMTAGGKSILAFRPDDWVDEVIERHGLQPLTKNTITDREELLEELEVIKEQKYAFDRQEAIIGMKGIAAPILDREDTAIGAINSYVPVDQIDDDRFMTELPVTVRERANIVELNINY